MKKVKKLSYVAMFVVLAMMIQLFSGVTFTVPKALALEPLEDLTLFGRFSQLDVSSLGHVRVTERFMDKMNMIEYENSDGTCSTYLFAQPIKYLDTATNTVRYVKDENDIPAIQKTMNAIVASADPVSYAPVQDIDVGSRSPNMNNVEGSSVTVGYIPYSGATFETYVKFDLSAIQGVISHNQVVSACYAMYQETEYTCGETVNIACYRVAENWNPNTVTWNTKPACDDAYLSVESVHNRSKNGESDTDWVDERIGYHYFMITNLAQGWLQGIPNYGLAFKRISGVQNNRTFASTESYLTSRIPFFRITYTTNTANMDNIGIKHESVYYIKQNGLYLDSSDYTLSKQPFTGEATQQWEVCTSGDGYFYLISANVTFFGLRYTSSGISLGDMDFVTENEFKFTRNWNGTYHISTRSYPNKGLGSPSPTSSGITLRTLGTSLTNYDDWTLEAAGEDVANWVMSDAVAALTPEDIAAGEEVPSSVRWVQGDSNIEDGLRHGGWNFTLVEGADAITAARLLATSNFCGLHAHGGQGCLDYTRSPFRWLAANTVMRPGGGQSAYGINSLNDNALASTRVVLLAACSAGNDATTSATLTDNETQEVYNLASAIYNKGAHVVISFVNPAAAQNWYFIFFGICAQGKTIAEAMAEADAYVLNSSTNSEDMGNILNRHVLGDTNLRMNVY